jgi:hypothetical protein
MIKRSKKVLFVSSFIFLLIIIVALYLNLFTKKYFYNERISLTISTDKKEYLPGETIKINTSIYNNSSDNIMYSTECAPINIENQFPGSVFIATKYNNIYPSQKGIDNNIVCAGGNSLKPSELKKGIFEWDQEIEFPNSSIQLPSGEYEIIVSFTDNKNYDKSKKTETYSASTKIVITGNEKEFITKEEAKTIALSDDIIKTWYENHEGINIVKEKNDKCYIENGSTYKYPDNFCDNLKDRPDIIKNNDGCYSIKDKELTPQMCEEMKKSKPAIRELLVMEGSKLKWFVLIEEDNNKNIYAIHEALNEDHHQIGIKIDAYSKEILEKLRCELYLGGNVLPKKCEKME